MERDVINTKEENVIRGEVDRHVVSRTGEWERWQEGVGRVECRAKM